MSKSLTLGSHRKLCFSHLPPNLNIKSCEEDSHSPDEDEEDEHFCMRNQRYIREALFELQSNYRLLSQPFNSCENIFFAEDAAGKWVLKLCVLADEEYEKQTSQEVRSLVLAKGIPNVCQLHKWHFLRRNGEFKNTVYALVMPVYTQDSTEDMNLEDIRTYMFQILNALKALKDRNIFYRDVKPENILWNNTTKQAILMDFDVSRENPEELFDECMGTEGFWSPEAEKGVGYNYKHDVYAAGVTLGLLLFGMHTTDACKDFVTFLKPLNKKQKKKKNKANKYKDLAYKGDEHARDLLLHMLKNDPSKRYSYEECLAHPFFAIKWSNGCK